MRPASRAKVGVARVLEALDERGFICRITHKARAIEVLRLPNGKDACSYKPGANTQDRSLFDRHYEAATKRDRLPIRVPA